MRTKDHDCKSAAADVSLAVLIAEKVALSDDPYAHRGSCPSHPDPTRSLYVNDAAGFFYCFGCRRGGDAVTWLMTHNGLSEAQALAALRSRKHSVRGRES